MRFRPCIDLHEGKVKQLVGGSLREEDPKAVQENFVADRPAAAFARLYREDGLPGGHVILLGPGNEDEALSALRAYPGGLQVGGGLNPDNAQRFLDAGASHVIVTSYVFRAGRIDSDNLRRMVEAVSKERLVLDLSCRRRGDRYLVVTDRWQRFTEVEVNRANLEALARHCSEFLVHAADVEGKREGIQEDLVASLGEWSPVPTTYAGGATSLADLDRVNELGDGRIDLTIGSALDLFGGDVPYRDVVRWHRARNPGSGEPPAP
ncbi:MAG: phosphoribosylformimino-5-aminoimidazole carboxamide ribotide isomerase [Armatimonadetes bacterium CG_4_8_14_3_um_filter_66_20]|nr:MAG: phosphoribosylformimino-5-aminoimidazole carboxamide ribotide isomerase [Armatimonadetes bacterium CG_4_8_14_3_um_filter_66_20]